jgi:two-component system, response regulator PdtaR
MTIAIDQAPDAGTVALKILVVEDEAMVAMLIEDALSLHGHAVIGVADTAAAALDMVEHDRPDLALCDVKLADGDSGVTVAQSLSARGIPCLFLSGNCPPRTPEPLIIGCLPKPFHTATIGVAVQAAHAIAIGCKPNALPPGMILYRN